MLAHQNEDQTHYPHYILLKLFIDFFKLNPGHSTYQAKESRSLLVDKFFIEVED